MLLATVEVLTAAVGRWPGVRNWSAFGNYATTDLLVAALLVYDILSLGRVHAATVVCSSADPSCLLFDGSVSFFRVYLEDDLRQLVREVPEQERFNWDIGSITIAGTSLGLTYLVDIPRH
jgi:hypothetical protein